MLAFIATAITSTAQENGAKRRHFSPEEFQAKQQEYITNKAGLTQAEADAFFPLFFELQKKKFELERNVRKEVSIRKAPEEKVGRNDPCPCGSGKKYKNCCGAAQNK